MDLRRLADLEANLVLRDTSAYKLRATEPRARWEIVRVVSFARTVMSRCKVEHSCIWGMAVTAWHGKCCYMWVGRIKLIARVRQV